MVERERRRKAPIYAADQGLKGAKVVCEYKQRLNGRAGGAAMSKAVEDGKTTEAVRNTYESTALKDRKSPLKRNEGSQSGQADREVVSTRSRKKPVANPHIFSGPMSR